MSEHTPGPWEAQPPLNPNDDYADISGPEHIGLAAVVWNIDGKPDEVCQANARLISAAPELLEALEIVEPVIDAMTASVEPGRMIRAAISKARGKE